MRPIFRYLLLVLLLGLQALTLVGILTSNQLRTQGVLREHAQSVMNHLADTAADNTRRFLAPAERSASLTRELLEENVISGQLPELKSKGSSPLSNLEIYLLSQLRSNPELTSVYFGTPKGEFSFVRREKEGFLLRRIYSQPTRRVLEQKLDRNGKINSYSFDPNNTFDPRKRPWYQAAEKVKGKIWTEPYIFFSSKKPGITAAVPVFDKARRLMGVVGSDIEISGLSAFLEEIPISVNGSAFIMTAKEQVVAYPQLEGRGPTDKLQGIRGVASPSVKALLDQYPSNQIALLSRRTFKDFSLDGQPQYGVLSPISIDANNTWFIGVQAPAKDFVGKIASLDNQYRWQIMLIGLASFLLAIPLAFGVTRPMLLLYNQATTDALTGLPNRSEFLRKAKLSLQQAQRKNIPSAVVMLDLDGFKEVNDHFGHPVGDEVLIAVAKRLSHVVRDGDLVGRLGGDEFAIILNNVQPYEVEPMVDRIRASISDQPLKSAKGLHPIGVSAGVVMPGDGSLLDYLSKADEALLKAKYSGKNRTLVVE